MAEQSGQARGWPQVTAAQGGSWLQTTCRPVRSLLALALSVAAPIAAAADSPEHLVAVVATTGSAHQPYGSEVAVGARAVADRLNAEGGVLGAAVRLATWTEDCSRESAARVADEVARLKPAVVIGHLCVGAALSAAPIYAKAGILFIAPGVRHPSLTKPEIAGGRVLRLAGRDDRFARDTVAFIRSRYAGKTIAVIADRTRQARALADGVVATARLQNVAVALDVRIESGEKSYDKLAADVKASSAGVVVMPAQPVELGVVVASLRRAGVEAPIVGSDILAVPALAPIAEAEGRRLVVMMPWTGLESASRDGASPAHHDDGRTAVRRRAEAALELWADAATRARSTEAIAIVAAARTNGLPTAVGPLRFDAAGDAMVPGYVASIWRDGRWQALTD